MKLINNLNETVKSKKYAILLRHSDRNNIPSGSVGNEIELNELGFQNAYNYGIKIADFKLNKIFCSPVTRCVQTAQQIVKAIDKNIEIIPTNILGSPSVYIENENVADKIFKENRFFFMIEKLFANEKVDGFRTMSEGSEMLKTFLEKNSNENGLTYFVTHDSLLAMFKFHFFGIKHTSSNWLKFLEEVIIEF